MSYNNHVESLRKTEYPMLKDAIYLDHAGTPPCAKSVLDRFSRHLTSNLYGNPHSASASSQLSTTRIENVRLRALRFFNASPEDYDLIFVANATAGIKLVADAFSGQRDGFTYIYHIHSHTSLVGARECASGNSCVDDEDVYSWLSRSDEEKSLPQSSIRLFAYPAQSNMDGRRLDLTWSKQVRQKNTSCIKTFTLLDAAAYASTSQLDLRDVSEAADFTVVSFSKIFGFPNIGGLIVRKETGNILLDRKYFGGGTVELVLCQKESWHERKQQTLHEALEDGTLPIHSIIALDAAMDVHTEMFTSMDLVARHVAFLAEKLYVGLKNLRHGNSQRVCEIYTDEKSSYLDTNRKGPIIAFNIRNSYGAWISVTEFEKLANIRNFHVRTGSACNPGGIASSLGLEPWEMKRNFSAGFRCGSENDIIGGKPTGIIRASLGALSTLDDVDKFIAFVREFYVELELPESVPTRTSKTTQQPEMVVESLMIYPIKSCGGLSIPKDAAWEVRPEGLAWDREWFLVHQGTGHALSQKKYPRMVLIRPVIDLGAGLLRIRCHGQDAGEISVPLSANPSVYTPVSQRSLSSRVCGDTITAQTYADKTINDWFSQILDVPCALARFPAGGIGPSSRHSKAHMQKHQSIKGQVLRTPMSVLDPPSPPDSDSEISRKRPILLSNESPILAINKSSLDALNAEILRTGGKPASASVFRANIVLASTTDIYQDDDSSGQEVLHNNAYEEDHWDKLRIGNQMFQMLGSCRRCHMICVDQNTAVKDEEPFITLSKTRRFEGKVFFGSHMCHVGGTGVDGVGVNREQQFPTIMVGDKVDVVDS